jgi:hypothetical protein
LQAQVRQYLLTARRSSFGQAPVGSRFNRRGLQNIAVIYLGKTVFFGREGYLHSMNAVYSLKAL